jgi:chaperonin GroES
VKELRPLDDYVLVRSLSRQRTEAGIILPHGERSSNHIAEVIAVGPGRLNAETKRRVPVGLSAGDIILMMEYAGEWMELRDGKYRFVHEHGIWARVELKGEYVDERDALVEVTALYPRSDHVSLRLKDELKSQGGVYFPSGGNKGASGRLGYIVLAGPGKYIDALERFEPLGLQAGDMVLFRRYDGSDIRVAGEELRILQSEGVVCVVEGYEQ